MGLGFCLDEVCNLSNSCGEWKNPVTYLHHSNYGLVESKIVGLGSNAGPSDLR